MFLSRKDAGITPGGHSVVGFTELGWGWTGSRHLLSTRFGRIQAVAQTVRRSFFDVLLFDFRSASSTWRLGGSSTSCGVWRYSSTCCVTRWNTGAETCPP